jgi:hypothetical protein
LSIETAVFQHHIEEFALRELFSGALGWQSYAGDPLRVEVDGTVYSLTGLASRNGGAALLLETPIGSPAPDYATRRAIKQQVTRTQPQHIIILTDVLQTTQIWQWTHHEPGWPASYREYSHFAGHTTPALLRELEAFLAHAFRPVAPLGTEHTAGAAGTEQVARNVLPALLSRVRQHCPSAFAPGSALMRLHPEQLQSDRTRLSDHPAGQLPDLRSFAQEAIEQSDDPALLRAFWRALSGRTRPSPARAPEPGFAVLDPECGTGERLCLAFEVLQPIYHACLERMGSWVDDMDRSRTSHRPEKLGDFRALLTRSGDTRQHASRRHFVAQLILQGNLYGIDPSPAAVQHCRRWLLQKWVKSGEEIETVPCVDLNLRVGNVRVGFATREETQHILAGATEPERMLQRIDEDAEAADRALGMLRRARHTHGTDTGELRQAAAELRRRRRALSLELDRALAVDWGIDPQDADAFEVWRERERPFHWSVEFHRVMNWGGFDVVLGDSARPGLARPRRASSVSPVSTGRGAPAGRVRERTAPFGSDTDALPQFDEATRMTIEPIHLHTDAPAYPAVLPQLLREKAPARITARGNLSLLTQPLLALFCSVRAPGSVVLRTYDLARSLRDAGVPTIGGFQSPLERECLDFLLRGTQPVVICPARGIEEMRIPDAWQAPLTEGRLLLLSPFNEKQRRPTATLAQQRNYLVAALARQIFIAHAVTGGRTYSVAKQALDWGKPVFTFDEHANTDLRLLGAGVAESTTFTAP